MHTHTVKKQVFRKFSTSFLIVMVKPNNYKNKAKKQDKNKLIKKKRIKNVLKFNKISTKPNKHTNKTTSTVLHFDNHFLLDCIK